MYHLLIDYFLTGLHGPLPLPVLGPLPSGPLPSLCAIISLLPFQNCLIDMLHLS